MTTAFYALEDFPQLANLVAHCSVIQEELATLDAPLLEIDRTNKQHQQVHEELTEHLQQGGDYGWLKGWGAEGGNRDWTQYALLFRDTPIGPAQATMPRTLELFKPLKGIKVVALARMAPHSFLSLHRHPELTNEGLLQMHITLSAANEANYSYLNVAGEFYHQKPGTGAIFDGSLDHFAVNATPVQRTIIYMEFEKEKFMKH
ncbi:aspartyl/asparaginyl beta-hydroxylase domain-containing protein [Pseudomonas capsici]|uniref:Aspartyl/asparaginyl beta-hydroxylase domain-containing protein n=1 Tax=Pseudomonas capsici TaxID=2810614 RepID=A0ABT3C030_9PSED|nr:aspartyl/asparaginyl beta-hydroxylase domain-containing protein [Pseudomonas capsici]MCV4269345.1 aspartyl/asparaginyl beta-hydroxylase domain-containing protein [Pseudomonas capsici]MCV4279825.1 aspartyl/asparaginyl beta-hydroxylase domain-containing protein [Pseudomonas capsici]MCV4333054.1 aspartyl/asparaginyl beta-hydroxylase domain-containing protein [Pseudomonas capsici]MCV4378436.1 aspartyl/asparaginyl beta-hydroxylase domain-containing protein [Pseudomonas capsici]